MFMQIWCQIKAQTLFLSPLIIKEMEMCNFFIKNKQKLIPLTFVTPSFDFPKNLEKVGFVPVTFRRA